MKDPSRARVTGPLEQYASGFVAELARLGYTGNSASGQMFVMGHLSRWLAAGGLDAAGLTPEQRTGSWPRAARRDMCCICRRKRSCRCLTKCMASTIPRFANASVTLI